MVSCEDFGRLITPYLDEEVDAEQRQAVERHLEACRPCARRAQAEGTARRVLMIKASTLSTPAPAALRERCAALAPRPARRPWWVVEGWRHLGLVSATAAMLLAVVALGFGVVTHSPTLLAAELSLDHMKCFALFEPREAQPDPKVVARQLENDYGWRFTVPGGLPEQHLALVGARRCLSTDGTVAHVLYRHAGRSLSLFIMPRTDRPSSRVDVVGHVVLSWSGADASYVVLGDEPESDLRQVVEYFRGAGL